ncbi:MAG: FAD-dependent oxidoreductase [Bacillota bacterium]
MGKKVVVIGGVAGGAGVAARLRRLDESAQIAVFERGEYVSYANCGLPYHVGNVIKEREALILNSPQKLRKNFRLDLRTSHEVVKIDRQSKSVRVKNLQDGTMFDEPYDTLVISTGSSPLRPPIEGIDSDGIFTLWTIPDTDRIKAYIGQNKPKRAAIIGGGFIGIEMAENLREAGLEVSLIEMLPQVMPSVDVEMARLLEQNLSINGVRLYLGDAVGRFEKEGDRIGITLKSGAVLETDMVLLCIGVRPNSELARDAGLQLNEKGGIVVDASMRTSDENIYAVGDVVEIEEFVFKGRTMVPLAGPANKQARICANNIAGIPDQYEGTQGSFVAKSFDLTVASTGLSESALKRMGKGHGRDYQTILVNQKSHAGYYPGATRLVLKLIFGNDGKIYGAQIVGQDGVDKRIDTLAAALRLGANVKDLKNLEFAYAPPYSSAKDPVNMLGYVAENVLSGLMSFVPYDLVDASGKYLGGEDAQILDVREEAERMMFSIDGAIGIPLGQLRARLSELDKNKLVIVFCAVGIRAFTAARILSQNGFERVKVYPGGASFFQSVYYMGKDDACKLETCGENAPASASAKASLVVDCFGMQCPGPIMKVYQAMKEIAYGETVEVVATDLGFARDIESWCKHTGNTLVKAEKQGNKIVAILRKGTDAAAAAAASVQSAPAPAEGKTIIVFSGDFDKVMAAFIIANGAAALGKPVTLFFTFWGLNALRKTARIPVKKPLIDAMFGKMMPRGVSRLKISKLNMGGMGTAMMRRVMKGKNVDSLEALVKQAMDNGVKLIACTMSMDVMGITKEELIDGIEYAGVSTYLGEAEGSNVNLFI